MSSLRDRQAAVIREAIPDALAARLDHDNPDDVAMPQIAADAGISLRTLYRYFPTREAMFDAVGDHVVARLGLPLEMRLPDRYCLPVQQAPPLARWAPEGGRGTRRGRSG